MKKRMLAVLAMSVLLTAPVFAAEFSADIRVKASMGIVQMGGDEGIPARLYHKGSGISRHEVMNMVTIVKPPLSYQLFSNTQKYVVTNLDEAADEAPYDFNNVYDFKQFVRDNDFNHIGTETLQGFECEVYEGTTVMQIEEEGESFELTQRWKLWVADRLNYPVRTEIQTSVPGDLPEEAGGGFEGSTTMELRNIALGDQPDDLFEIPAGYAQAGSFEEAMGLGAMHGLQGGLSEMPSEAEMQEIMDGLQDMIQGFQAE